jgi:hypothetical protein
MNTSCIICGANAYFNFPDFNNPIFCLKHKMEGNINIVENLCNCNTRKPEYGYKNSSRKSYCRECKNKRMIFIKKENRVCSCGKTKNAFFNYKGFKRGSHCLLCMKHGMVNVVTENLKKELLFYGEDVSHISMAYLDDLIEKNYQELGQKFF